MRDRWTGGRALALRWLGVGLAAALAVVTLGLWATGRIGLYINPDAAWWAVSMSFVLLLGAVASCAVPISRGEHEHEDGHGHGRSAEAEAPAQRASETRRAHAGARSPLGVAATAVGAAVSTAFVGLALLMPPASLSSELALARAVDSAPVLSTSASLALATSDDTSSFGVGEWASVLTTSTDPARFVGEPAVLTGFVAPGEDGVFHLTRLVIVHCVIDAQAASIPVAVRASDPELAPGDWVEVSGAFASSDDGGLVLEPVSVTTVDEPGDPYEY